MDSVSPNAEQSTDGSIESRSNKRRKMESVPLSLDQIKWRSSTEEISYSSKLVEALRRISPPSNASSHNRLVRETADKVLAIAARGRSRWSRAILAKRCKLQLKNHKKAAKPNLAKTKKTGTETPAKPLPPLQQCARILGRMVPGGRSLSLPNLLEELTDYISALEMQVRALALINQVYSGAGGTSDHPGFT